MFKKIFLLIFLFSAITSLWFFLSINNIDHAVSTLSLDSSDDNANDVAKISTLKINNVPIISHYRNLKLIDKIISLHSTDIDKYVLYTPYAINLLNKQIKNNPYNALSYLQLAYLYKHKNTKYQGTKYRGTKYRGTNNISNNKIWQNYLLYSYQLSPFPHYKLTEQRLTFCLINWNDLSTELKHTTRKSLKWYRSYYRWYAFKKNILKQNLPGQANIIIKVIDRKKIKS